MAFILAIGLWNTALCTQAFAALLLFASVNLFTTRQVTTLSKRKMFLKVINTGSNHQDFFNQCTDGTRPLGWGSKTEQILSKLHAIRNCLTREVASGTFPGWVASKSGMDATPSAHFPSTEWGLIPPVRSWKF